MESGSFVKIINYGNSYDMHPRAKEYGLTNYHFWLGKPHCNDGDILQVVSHVVVNRDKDALILKDKEGIEYLIDREGCSEFVETVE